MPKKNPDNNDAPILVLSREEFKVMLEKQIAEGNDILKINVPLSNPTSYYGGYGYTDFRKKVYDDAKLGDFKKLYSKWNDFNKELLKRAFSIPSNEYLDSYSSCALTLVWGDGNDPINTYKEVIENEISKLDNLINKLPLIPSKYDDEETIRNEGRYIKSSSIPTKKVSSLEKTGKDVFIVHGHDNELKQTVARVLEKLDLHAIILHEQPNQGMTIIEKLEKAASSAGFAVILLTADDTGKAKRETEYKDRARQNVVFEMGYFIAKLGRNRVMLLLENGVDKPGDLDGLVYTAVDPNDGWKLSLVKELKSAGYHVSADKIL